VNWTKVGGGRAMTSLEELLTIDGVAAAGEFAPDGSLLK